ncbi:hypothetical protein ACMWQA_26895, partial [Escherichia coli]
QVDSAKSYDDRVYKRQDEGAQFSGSATAKESYKESTNEGESVGKGRVRTQGAISRESRNGVDVSAKSTVTSETGGSTTRKATD